MKRSEAISKAQALIGDTTKSVVFSSAVGLEFMVRETVGEAAELLIEELGNDPDPHEGDELGPHTSYAVQCELDNIPFDMAKFESLAPTGTGWND